MLENFVKKLWCNGMREAVDLRFKPIHRIKFESKTLVLQHIDAGTYQTD